MSSKIEIRITKCVNDSRFERVLLGGYYWKSMRMDSFESKRGFARSEEGARKKAEKAAKSLLPEPVLNYTLEI